MNDIVNSAVTSAIQSAAIAAAQDAHSSIVQASTNAQYNVRAAITGGVTFTDIPAGTTITSARAPAPRISARCRWARGSPR